MISSFVMAYSLPSHAGTTPQAESTTEATQSNECFRHHIREAMRLNRERRPLYAQLSNYESIEISNRLIFLESLVKTGTYLFANYDREARPFQEAGIPIVCAEYVDMKHVPPFQEGFKNGAPDIKNFKKLDSYVLKKALKRAFADGDLSNLHATLTPIIEDLEREPRFNCLLRHTLESMARIAWLAPAHEARAKELGLSKSPLELSKKMIDGHFMLMKDIIALDEQAAKVQAMNIPIICQDVPAIPWREAVDSHQTH